MATLFDSLCECVCVCVCVCVPFCDTESLSELGGKSRWGNMKRESVCMRRRGLSVRAGERERERGREGERETCEGDRSGTPGQVPLPCQASTGFIFASE
ncbi:MAG TPA: hypothetical protein V6C97_07375 [Oculatellaceae cyanobacterium]